MIGYAGVKSTPTFFNVKRSYEFLEIEVPISFEQTLVNEGEAMDAATGIFTANRAGTYLFSFTGLAVMLAKSSPSQYFEIVLYLNDGEAIVGSDQIKGQVSNRDDTIILIIQAIVDLLPDDRICLKLSSRTKEAYLYSVEHFIGWMLEEKIGATNN